MQPVVHLELHTRDTASARDMFAELCGWRVEEIRLGAASYLAVELGGRHGGLGGGLVACAADRPTWVPYVGVRCVEETTDRARDLGATVLLEPREGRNGWRSVVSTVQGGEIAFWQPRPATGRRGR